MAFEALLPLIYSLAAGRRKKKKEEQPAEAYRGSTGGAAPPPIPIAPTNNVNLGTAGDPRFAPSGPPPMQMPAEGGGGGSDGQWLAAALSAIGGAPDRNAYTAPFKAAAGRAQAANAQALPQIASGYDRLRGALGTAQAETDQASGQARAAMQGQQAASQAQIAALVAPVLAQLKAAGGNAALGSLTGAMQAQVGVSQGQLAQQGAAQTQLSQNLQASGTASHNSRIADSQLAQQSATSSANNNLSQVLNALDSRKADALKQFAADSAQHSGRVASAKMSAMERAEAKAEKANDPGRAIDLERARIALESDRLDLDDRKGSGPAAGPNQYKAQVNEWHSKISQSNPQSYSFLVDLMGDGKTELPALLGRINTMAKNGKVKDPASGKSLDARWLRDRLTELDDAEQRFNEEEERRSQPSSRKRR